MVAKEWVLWTKMLITLEIVSKAMVAKVTVGGCLGLTMGYFDLILHLSPSNQTLAWVAVKFGIIPFWLH